MGTKKKSCNVSWFIVLVIALLVCSITILLSSCSYAMTSEEVTDFLDTAKEQMQEIEQNDFVLNWFNKAYNYINYFTNFECISIGRAGNYYRLSGFNLYDNTIYCYYQGGTTNQFVAMNLGNTNRTYMQYALGNNVTGSNSYNFFASTSQNYVLGGTNIISNTIFYDGLNSTTEYSGNNYIHQNAVPPNSITLSATSNHKFGFTSRNQLFVEFTGDWTTSDFTFYIQKLNGSNWETVTNYNDYSILAGYDNPYFIFWADINYLPVGTYRYVADYGSLGTDLYYSNNFNITSSYIEDNVTGTITDNGNGNSSIDINIDSGNSVDNIKDFIGSPADISDLEINSDTIHEAIGLQNQVNPYDNFVLTFFSGLSGALTTVTPQQFRYQVHDWGPIRNVSVADITPQYSYGMASFLSTVSSLVVVFVIVKWTTSIIESLNTADVSRTLELVEEKYSDLF